MKTTVFFLGFVLGALLAKPPVHVEVHERSMLTVEAIESAEATMNIPWRIE